jgi:hypothetical protein
MWLCTARKPGCKVGIRHRISGNSGFQCNQGNLVEHFWWWSSTLQACATYAWLLDQAVPCPAFHAIHFIVNYRALLATDDSDTVFALALDTLVAVLDPFRKRVAVEAAFLIVFHYLLYNCGDLSVQSIDCRREQTCRWAFLCWFARGQGILSPGTRWGSDRLAGSFLYRSSSIEPYPLGTSRTSLHSDPALRDSSCSRKSKSLIDTLSVIPCKWIC